MSADVNAQLAEYSFLFFKCFSTIIRNDIHSIGILIKIYIIYWKQKFALSNSAVVLLDLV